MKKQTTQDKAEEAARIGVEFMFGDRTHISPKELHRVIKNTFILGASWGKETNKENPQWTSLM